MLKWSSWASLMPGPAGVQASMTREKFPEKVPFRLTRMMIKAMEVSGIEGNFRYLLALRCLH